jgi:histone deacetylase HOS3
VDLLNHPAVKFVHGDIDGDVYLETLKTWAENSQNRIANGLSEIPEEFSQGDLYRAFCFGYKYFTHVQVSLVCPTSVDAMQAAIGAVCEAVDTVVTSDRPSLSHPTVTNSTIRVVADRAFVAVRPPGHHCGEDTPNGFCFLNNVVVGAAHGKIILAQGIVAHALLSN